MAQDNNNNDNQSPQVANGAINSIVGNKTKILEITPSEELYFDFDMENVKISITDVDIVLTFENGGKIILAGAAMLAALGQSPIFNFRDAIRSAFEIMKESPAITHAEGPIATTKMTSKNTAPEPDNSNDIGNDDKNIEGSTQPIIVEVEKQTFAKGVKVNDNISTLEDTNVADYQTPPTPVSKIVEQLDDNPPPVKNSGGNSDGKNQGGANDGANSGGANDGANSGGANNGANSGGANNGANSGGANDGANSGGANDGANSGGANDGTNSGGANNGANSGGANNGANSGSQSNTGKNQGGNTNSGNEQTTDGYKPDGSELPSDGDTSEGNQQEETGSVDNGNHLVNSGDQLKPTPDTTGVGKPLNIQEAVPKFFVDVKGDFRKSESFENGKYVLKGGFSSSSTSYKFDKKYQDENLTGTSGDDIIFADNPDIVPSGYGIKKILLSWYIPVAEWTTKSAKLLTSDKYTLVDENGAPFNPDFTASQANAQRASFYLIYKLPEESQQPDNRNIYDQFQLGIDLTITSPEGLNYTISGSKGFVVRDVNSIADEYFSSSETKQSFSVLPSTLIGNEIHSNSGDDLIHASGAADTIDGGQGNDTVSYEASSSGVDVRLNGSTSYSGFAKGDKITNVENIIGSDYNDRFYGTNNNEVFEGKAGADTIIGGGGNDTASYKSSDAAVTVNLTTGSNSGGDATGDRLINISNIIGSNHNDVLDGNTLSNTISGGDGDDIINGRGGADTLDGGAGIDTVSYETSNQGVHVNLTTNINTQGDAQGDKLKNFENIIGSSQQDILTGNAEDNIIDGGDGGDTIIGAGGSDTVDYSKSNAAVEIDFDKNLAFGGYATGDQISGVENIIGSRFDDKIILNDIDNIVNSGKGDDIITLKGGADTIDAGDGEDSIKFTGDLSEWSLKVNDDKLFTVTSKADSSIIKTLTNVEKFIFDDRTIDTSAFGANPPTDISVNLATPLIPDIIAADSLIATLTATDPDVGDIITFSIENDTLGIFKIVNNTIVRSNTGFIDGGTTNQYTVRLVATDLGGNAYGKNYTFTFEDLNNPPYVDAVQTMTSIDHFVDTTDRVKVADVTLQDDAIGTATKYLTGLNASYFEWIGDSLYLKKDAIVDVRKNDQLFVNINVDDPTIGARPDSQVKLVFDINNTSTAPTKINSKETIDFISNGSFEKLDGLATTTTTGATSKDALPGWKVIGGEVEHTNIHNFQTEGNYFLKGNSFNNDNFAIETNLYGLEEKTIYKLLVDSKSVSGNPHEGIMNVTWNGILVGQIDPGATIKQYTFNLNTDAGNKTGTLAFSSIDGKPAFLDNVKIEGPGAIVSETASDNDIVTSLSVIDSDKDESFTYKLTNSAGNKFYLDGTDVKIKPGAFFNAANEPNHTIEVQVTDSFGNIYSQELNIKVKPLNTTPSNVQLSNKSIDENSDGGVIGIITAQDQENETLRYKILNDNRFEIVDDGNGNMQVKLKQRETLDYESEQSINLQIAVADETGNSRVTSFSIDVNNVNETPTDIIQDEIIISKNNEAGQLVARIEGEDPDAGETLTYSLVDDRNGLFKIDADTGNVYITRKIDFVNIKNLALYTDFSSGSEDKFNIDKFDPKLGNPGQGTLQRGATLTTGNNGEKVAHLVGLGTGNSSSAIKLPNIKYSESFTVAIRVDVNAYDTYSSLIDLSRGAAKSTISLYRSGDTNSMHLYITEQDGTVFRGKDIGTFSTDALDDDFDNYIIRFEQKHITVYSNGNIIFEGNMKAPLNKNILATHNLLGHSNWSGENGTEADYSKAAIFNRALSDSEIQELNQIMDGESLVDIYKTIDVNVTDSQGHSITKTINLVENSANQAPTNIELSGTKEITEGQTGLDVGILSATDKEDILKFKEQTSSDEHIENVALNKTAHSSSTWSSSKGADLAVDGKDKLSFRAFISGRNDPNAWWNVDLGRNHTSLTKLVFYPRNNIGQNNALNDQIYISDTITTDKSQMTLIGTIPSAYSVSEFDLSDVSGRYIYIFNNGKFLTFSEVEVFARLDSNGNDYNNQVTLAGKTGFGYTFNTAFDHTLTTAPEVELPTNITDTDGKTYDVTLGTVTNTGFSYTLYRTDVLGGKISDAPVFDFNYNDNDASNKITYSVSDNRFEVVTDADGKVHVKLKATESLDYSSEQYVNLTVTATDKGGLSSTKDFSIKVLDTNSAPTDISLSNSSVSENRPDIIVGELSTTDTDQNETFTYSIVNNSNFVIDQKTDGTYVLKTSATSKFDFESANSTTVTVQSTDSKNQTTQKTFTINITDANDAPTGLSLSSTDISDSTLGATVGVISVTDVDPTDSFTFISSNPIFEIVKNSANNWILKLKNDQELDANLVSSLSTKITVKDSGGENYFQDFTINVVDKPEAPTDIFLTDTQVISENNSDGHIIGTLTAKDPDAGDNNHSFSTNDVRFEIVTASNGSKQLKLKAGSTLNYEDGATQKVEITATDRDGLRFSKKVSFEVSDVNEAPSAIFLSSTSFDENIEGAVIATVTGVDPELDNLTWKVSDNRFVFTNNTLKLAAGVKANFEKLDKYSLTLTATDPSGLHFSKDFTITVNDVNETPTEFILPSRLSFQASAVNGEVLATPEIKDPDNNETFTYSLSDDLGGTIQIDANTGEISLKNVDNLKQEIKDGLLYAYTFEDGSGKKSTANLHESTTYPGDAALSGADWGTKNGEKVINLGAQSNTTVGNIELPSFTRTANMTVSLRIAVAPTAQQGKRVRLFDANNGPSNDEFMLLRNHSSNDFRFIISDGRSRFADYNFGDWGDIADGQLHDIQMVVNGTDFKIYLDGNVYFTATLSSPLSTKTLGRVYVGKSSFVQDPILNGEVSDFRLYNKALSATEITTLNTHLAAGDFEKENVDINSWSTTVTAIDSGGKQITKDVSFTFNDVPTDITISGIDTVLDENRGNQVIGLVTATDPNNGDTFTFTVDDDRFEIVSRPGLALLRLKADQQLDFEEAASITINVTATDNNQGQFTKQFTVFVNDVDEAPTQITITNQAGLNETSNKQIVGNLITDDPEGNIDTVFVSNDSRFEVVINASGQPQLRLIEGYKVNFEDTIDGKISVNITSTDSSGISFTDNVIVNVNNTDESLTDIMFSNLDGTTSTILTAGTSGISQEFTLGAWNANTGDEIVITIGTREISYTVTADNADIIINKEIAKLINQEVPDIAWAGNPDTEALRDPFADTDKNVVTFKQSLAEISIGATLNGSDISSTAIKNYVAGSTNTNHVEEYSFHTVPVAGSLISFVIGDEKFSYVVTGKETDINNLVSKISSTINLYSDDLSTSASANKLVITSQDPKNLNIESNIVTIDGYEEVTKTIVTNATKAASTSQTIDLNFSNFTLGDVIKLTIGNKSVTHTVTDTDAGVNAKAIADLVNTNMSSIAYAGDKNNSAYHDTVTSATDNQIVIYASETNKTVLIDVNSVDKTSNLLTVTNGTDGLISQRVNYDLGTVPTSATTYSILVHGQIITFTSQGNEGSITPIIDGLVTAINNSGLVKNAWSDAGKLWISSHLGESSPIELFKGQVNDQITVGTHGRAGDVITTITTNDPDTDDTNFTYSLVDANGADITDTNFKIVNNQLVLKTNTAFINDIDTIFKFYIKVNDGSGNIRIEQVNIKVEYNGNPFTLSDGTSIDENIVGGTVSTIALSDPNAGSLTSITTNDVNFEIIENNGTYSLKLKSGVSFNFETTETTSVNIVATDSNGKTYQENVDITINNINEAPTGVNVNLVSDPIDLSVGLASRLKVADLVTQDDATGNNQNTIAGKDRNLFEIDNNVLYLKANAAVNFNTDPEARDGLDIKIYTYDTANTPTEDKIIVNIKGSSANGEYSLITDNTVLQSLAFSNKFNPFQGSSVLDISKPVYSAKIDGKTWYIWSRVNSGYHLSQLDDSSEWYWESSNTGVFENAPENVLNWFTSADDAYDPNSTQVDASFDLITTSAIESNIHINLYENLDQTISGTADDDTLFGANGNDSLAGSAGNDTLEGGKGIDSYIGGTGNDTFIIDNDDTSIFGSDGFDTVKFDTNSINNISDSDLHKHIAQMTDIEQIDFRGFTTPPALTSSEIIKATDSNNTLHIVVDNLDDAQTDTTGVDHINESTTGDETTYTYEDSNGDIMATLIATLAAA